MFSYRVKYTESEQDIHNNDLLYKIDQQFQKTFDILEHYDFLKTSTFSKCCFELYIIYIIHILYFV